jgi:hypothetical protein
MRWELDRHTRDPANQVLHRQEEAQNLIILELFFHRHRRLRALSSVPARQARRILLRDRPHRRTRTRVHTTTTGTILRRRYQRCRPDLWRMDCCRVRVVFIRSGVLEGVGLTVICCQVRSHSLRRSWRRGQVLVGLRRRVWERRGKGVKNGWQMRRR